jgi:hypothetical protein
MDITSPPVSVLGSTARDSGRALRQRAHVRWRAVVSRRPHAWACWPIWWSIATPENDNESFPAVLINSPATCAAVAA